MSIDLKNLNQDKEKLEKQSKTWSFLSADISFSKSKKEFSDKKRESFFSELSLLINSGLDLSTTLKLFINQENNKNDKLIYQTIYQNLLKGLSFSESVKSTSKFSDYDFYSIKMGEESGFLGEVLSELSTFYSRKIRYKRKIVSAISYPMLVLATAIVALIFMLEFLVPAFTDIFKRTNNELPSITKLIIKLSDGISSSLPYIIILLIAIAVFAYVNWNKKWFQKYYSSLLTRIPLVGIIIKIFYLERFFISMVLFSKSKVSLVNAIGLSKLIVNFYPFEIALSQIETDIVKGKLLSESMKDFKIFDAKTITLVKVGEEVNQLSSVFERLSKQHSVNLDYKIENISTFLEPVLILFVGLIVAVILVAMYLPIFQMGSYIQ